MNRKKWRALLVMAICILMTCLVAYPTSYFVLTKKADITYTESPTDPPIRFRYCRYYWAISFYQPLAKAEGKLRGENVQLTSWLSQAFQF